MWTVAGNKALVVLITFQSMPCLSKKGLLSHAGFTLIEMLVTISVATILVLAAAPSFVAFQKNAQLSEAVSNFIAATTVTRSNAMKQGLHTHMVLNDTAIGWSSGWMVYTDSNFNNTYEASEEVLLRHEAINSSVVISFPPVSSTSSLIEGYVLYNGSGYPRLKNGGFGGGTIIMSNSSRSISIIIDPAGRVRSCITGANGC